MTEPAGIDSGEPSILPHRVLDLVRDYLEVREYAAAHDVVRRALRRAYILGWIRSRDELRQRKPAEASPWDRSGRLPASNSESEGEAGA